MGLFMNTMMRKVMLAIVIAVIILIGIPIGISLKESKELKYLKNKVDFNMIGQSEEGSVDSTEDTTADKTANVISETIDNAFIMSGNLKEVKNTRQLTFFIGDDKDYVRSILGKPNKIHGTNNSTWDYSIAKIFFDNDGLVVGYINSNNELGDYLPLEKTNDHSVFIGSSQDEVIKCIGAPNKIEKAYQNEWIYDHSVITFDSSGKVNGYVNKYDELVDALPAKGNFSGYLFIGSDMSEVISRLGAPNKIELLYPNVWHYNNSSFNFDKAGFVNGYFNYYDELDKILPIISNGSGTFFMGDTKDFILSIMGPPEAIQFIHSDIWKYNQSTLFFDMNDGLNGYINKNSELDQWLPKVLVDSNRVFLGSTKDEVLKRIGPPKRIDESQVDTWNYRESKVFFDKEGFVSGYLNSFGQLDDLLIDADEINAVEVSEVTKMSSEWITIIKDYGTPVRIDAIEPSCWFYEDFKIEIEN